MFLLKVNLSHTRMIPLLHHSHDLCFKVHQWMVKSLFHLLYLCTEYGIYKQLLRVTVALQNWEYISCDIVIYLIQYICVKCTTLVYCVFAIRTMYRGMWLCNCATCIQLLIWFDVEWCMPKELSISSSKFTTLK